MIRITFHLGKDDAVYEDLGHRPGDLTLDDVAKLLYPEFMRGMIAYYGKAGADSKNKQQIEQ
jgi:hypothetical protein